MSRNINVQSIDALPRLRMALGKFSEAVCEGADDAERIATRNLERLADACYQLEREMRRREDDYDCADPEEDDMSYLAYMRDHARDRFEQARRARERAAEAGQELSACVRRIKEVAGSQLAEAQTLLGQKIVELGDYIGVQPAGYSGGGGLSSGAVSSNGAGVAHGSTALSLSESSYEDISRIPLPEGFRWMELDRVTGNALADLPALDDYGRKDITYDEMKAGLQTLERDILPAMQADPANTNGEIFEDPEKGHVRGGSKHIYDVFFGGDPVVVDYSVANSVYTSFTNGKHRTRIARDLGWKAIPAKVMEYDRT